jgi:hypothetical protein
LISCIHTAIPRTIIVALGLLVGLLSGLHLDPAAPRREPSPLRRPRGPCLLYHRPIHDTASPLSDNTDRLSVPSHIASVGRADPPCSNTKASRPIHDTVSPLSDKSDHDTLSLIMDSRTLPAATPAALSMMRSRYRVPTVITAAPGM